MSDYVSEFQKAAEARAKRWQEVLRIDREQLAQDIRIVDGNHDLSAAEVAEKLVARGWGRRP